MKSSLKCPKCEGVRVWIIESFRVPSDVVAGTELPVVLHQADRNVGFFGIPKVEPRGRFDLYACDGCGFSELYATGLETLEPDPEHGIRLVDAGIPQKGPFR